MSRNEHSSTSKPKKSKNAAAVLQLHLNGVLSKTLPTEVPPSMIQVLHMNDSSQHSCDSSYSSREDSDPILNIMSAPPPTNASSAGCYLPRDFMPRSRRERRKDRPEGDGDSSSSSSRGGSRGSNRRQDQRQHPQQQAEQQQQQQQPAVNPFAAPLLDQSSDDGSGVSEWPCVGATVTSQLRLRTRLSSANLGAASRVARRDRQRDEIRSMLETLSDLQHVFVANDNSSDNPRGCGGGGGGWTAGGNGRRRDGRVVSKEFAVRHFPNGDLFSGNVDSETGELIYGRMTCALQMEVYEGPFWKGKRHGEGAVCSKMDGGAKFLGRYHEGQMHSGTLIVTRNLPSDFTYTGTFLNNDFHGIGTIVSQNGSIYQGQFARGQYHGVGTLTTLIDSEEERGDNGRSAGGEKKESVYTGEFSEGLFHGAGTLTSSSESSFSGTWSLGQRVEGTETLSNGDVFEGSFRDDARQGQGVLRTKKGRITKSGMWEGNVLREELGDMEIMFDGGHVYRGDHAKSVPHGFGRMEYADLGSGEVHHNGWYVNGMRHGEGRCFFHGTGEEYEGEWACDEPVDLAVFQHDGPFDEQLYRPGCDDDEGGEEEGGGNSSVVEGEEGEDVVETIECPPTSCYGPSAAREGKERRGNGRDRGTCCGDLDSSLVSVCSADTQTSMTVSSSTRRSGQQNGSWRMSSADAENLSLSVKSLSAYECPEQGLRLYRYRNGDVFRGRLEEGTNLRQGSGVYTEHRMGSVYNGDWKDSKRHGVGHLRLASGMEYSGEFCEDMIHGQGSLTLIDGSVYMGSFSNGLFHGRGMLEDDSHNRVFFGEFENGERSGEGDETLSDSSRYKGSYRRGKRDGPGVLLDPDGREIYRGEWHEDLRHGRGRSSGHGPEGSNWEGSYDGDFFRDRFSGNGRFAYVDGTSIEGQWLDGVPRDGDWSIQYPDGSKFYGFATFQHPEEREVASDGSASSRGLTSAGSREFLRVPLPHGFGSLTYPSGRRFVGSFVYGEHNDGKKT